MATNIRVVILNFNGGAFVRQSVEAALALDWDDGAVTVVVVDNGSTDGSVADLRRTFGDRISLIENPRNTGFPANNLAMVDRAGIDYVALVNPDAFVDRGWLQPMVAAMEADPSIGATCPRMRLAHQFVDVELETAGFTPPGDPRSLGVRISGIEVAGAELLGRHRGSGVYGLERGPAAEAQFVWTADHARLGVPFLGERPDVVSLRLASPTPHTSVRIDGMEVVVGPEPEWFSVPLRGAAYDAINNAGSILVEHGFGADRGLGARDGEAFASPSDVFAWCGGGVLLRSAYLDDVGLFDETFFLYYEDTDLSWRGQARGWRYRYVPEATMRHVHAASTVVGSAMFDHYVERNRLLMVVKNAPRRLISDAITLHWRATVGAIRDDIIVPLRGRHRPSSVRVRRRMKSFAAFGWRLPGALVQRRTLRRRQTVADDVLMQWMEPQPTGHEES